VGKFVAKQSDEKPKGWKVN